MERLVVFIDTSALYSLLDPEEEFHDAAQQTWKELLTGGAVLVTTNYVLLETASLMQRRVGLEAVRVLHSDIAPVLQVKWITEEFHSRGIEATLIASRRKLSIVDCISFLIMRERRVTTAFTFDDHFREQGFTVVP